jgi:poly(A) polymerase
MEKKSSQNIKNLQTFLESYPAEIIEALFKLEKSMDQALYLVGGTVRDLLMGYRPNDIDIALSSGAYDAAESLIRLLGGGALVPLGTDEDDTCRVVFNGLTIDFADFRQGVTTIEEDLALRDFTVNSMACLLGGFKAGDGDVEIIDPLGGRADVTTGMLRTYPQSFEDDPLRLLRGYRFRATLGFEIDENLLAQIRRYKGKIERVAPERISYELNCIMESSTAYVVFREMAESGLFFHIIPELEPGVGMAQPESHHLDVFDHCLESLKWMEKILDFPVTFFPDCEEAIGNYLEDAKTRRNLKWAAFVHDLGKPAAHDILKNKGNRITFYNHDKTGKLLFLAIAKRLRWSSSDGEQVASLIEMHMHPFHLCNVQRKEKVSKRAMLKLYKKAGPHLNGLFLLAMADSLACQGGKAPENMGYELVELFCSLQETIDHIIQPVLKGPAILSGNDLKDIFKLSPGPIFSKILDALEVAQVEGLVGDRDQAIEWVRNYIATLERTEESGNREISE